MWSELAKIEVYDSHIKHISITKDAFPDDTEISLNKFLTYCSKIDDKKNADRITICGVLGVRRNQLHKKGRTVFALGL
jgi:hypothetical protein